MNTRRPRSSISRLVLAACMLALIACDTPPKSPKDIRDAQLKNGPTAPQPIVSDMDHCLAFLGDRLREQNIQPLLIGYSAVADTTGKTGVDFASVMRSALSKIIVRGNNLAATAMGFGPTPRPEVPSVEERELQRNPALAQRLVRPEWLITGGAVSMANAFMSVQDSVGVSSRLIDIAASGTTSVDLLSMSFGLKSVDSGIDLPKVEDVRVSAQVLSSAAEAGVFATARFHKKKIEAGLRLGRTVAVSQVLEDAIRVGMEWALVQLLANRFSVDMSECPMGALTPDEELPERERVPPAGELPKIYAAMSPAERIKWFQAMLATRGYAPGEADGVLGPQTRQALVRAAQDANLPPTGRATDALFYVLAARELAFGRDPRKPPPAGPTAPARIHVQLAQPNMPYTVGSLLRATVVPPQAGHMHCFLASPEGTVALYPILPSRGNFVRAGNPVLLPDNNASGPRVRLTSPGAHELWCGQARKNVDESLPAELRAGGYGVDTMSEVRQRYAQAAGADGMADGSVLFNVVAPTATR